MALRRVLRTHRIAIDWCFEVFDSPDIKIKFVGTKQQIADLMTKGFSKGDLWDSLTSQAGLIAAAPLSLRASCVVPALCVIPAMASSSSAPAGGDSRQPSYPLPGKAVQIFGGHDNRARFAHSLAQVTEALAAMLRKSEMSQLVAAANSKNIGAQLLRVSQATIDQTFQLRSSQPWVMTWLNIIVWESGRRSPRTLAWSPWQMIPSCGKDAAR